MPARIAVIEQVRNPPHAQPTPPWPVESYVDVRTGTRYRREVLGGCSGGRLLLGDTIKSAGLELYYRRVQGSTRQPTPSELDADLRRFVTKCWHEQLRMTGKPICQRQGNLVWLATVPVAVYGIEDTADGGSTLYRYMPLIQRPRGALAVPLGKSDTAHHLATQPPSDSAELSIVRHGARAASETRSAYG